MSKKNNQEPEEPEEPDYEEPTYNSTIGKKEKEINDKSLMDLVNQAQSKSKKGKKNRKEQTEAKNNDKKKKIVIEDINDLNNFNFANAPQKSAPQNDTKSDIAQYSQANYKNTAILATVSGQIEESDIGRFFNGLNIDKIHSEPGYFIIEFHTEEDLHKALQKNKTPYTNNITVLVGEYSVEDENPKPEKHDFPKSYQSSRYTSYNDFDDDDDYRPSYQNSKISLGAKHQQQGQQQPPPPSQTESTRTYSSRRQPGFISLGGKQQQQTDSYKPPNKSTSSSSKYVSPCAKADSKIPFGKQESFKPIVTSNSFEILKEEEGDK